MNKTDIDDIKFLSSVLVVSAQSPDRMLHINSEFGNAYVKMRCASALNALGVITPEQQILIVDGDSRAADTRALMEALKNMEQNVERLDEIQSPKEIAEQRRKAVLGPKRGRW